MQPPVIIVYNLDEASGFNAGTYLETYLTILNPNNNRLFQLPIRQSEEMNYFQAENIFTEFWLDHHAIDRCMETLCEVVQKPVFYNPSISKTGERFDPSTLYRNLPGDLAFQCPYGTCDQNAFSHVADVYSHMDMHHDNVFAFDGRPFRCISKECPKSEFPFKSSLLQHIDEEHAELKRGSKLNYK